MATLPPFEIREYRPGDEGPILECFNRAFAAIDPTFTPRTLAEWQWQYLLNPSGRRLVLGVAADGHVITQYAGVPQRLVLRGQPAHASQAVDSMTDPRYREGLKRSSPFVQAAFFYRSTYGGVGPGRDWFIWGLPVPIAWRIGKAQALYELIRPVLKLELLVAASRPAAGDGAALELCETREVPDAADALLERVAAQSQCIGVRDRAHLHWRYVLRPKINYSLCFARAAGGELRGYAVWRTGTFDQQQAGLLCDLLVAPNATSACAALLDWAAAKTRAANAERLVACMLESAPLFGALQRCGFRVRGTQYLQVGHSLTNALDIRWLQQHWYLTLGDTDLV